MSKDKQKDPFFIRWSQGRLNRRNYAIGLLLFLFYTVIVPIVSSIVFPYSKDPVLFTFIIVTEMLLGFAFLFSITARRYHDLGKNYWDAFHKYYPFSALAGLFIAGQNKSNKWGKPPEPKIDILNLLGFS